MTLRRCWRIIVRRSWVVLAAIIATAAPAIALSVQQSAVYQADARMLISSVSGDSVLGSVQSIDPDRLVQNEIAVLEGDVVHDMVIDNLRLPQDSTAVDPPAVTGRAFDDADVIDVRVRSGDRDTAAALANAYVAAYIDVKREQFVDDAATAAAELQGKVAELQTKIDVLDRRIDASTTDDDSALESDLSALEDQQSLFRQHIDQLQVDSAVSAGRAELVRPAAVPSKPVKPTPVRTATLAALVGLLLGLGAALLLDHLDDSVRSVDDLGHLGADLPVLAVVPNAASRDHRPLSISASDSPPVEAYRNLRTNIQFLGLDRTMRSIQVTSTRPGEGKSTTAANLAVVLSQTGANVVLVDADLRKPDLHRLFAIDGSNGLTNNLAGDPMELTIQRITDQLWVIVGGPIPANPSELLSGRRMQAFADELSRRFDYVIIDSAPLLAVSDAAGLSRHVDGVLIVAQAKRVSLPHLRESVAKLERVGAPIIGLVLNRAKVDSVVTSEYEYVEPSRVKRRR